jgi:hypothetical protein
LSHERITIAGRQVEALLPRTLLQIVFITATMGVFLGRKHCQQANAHLCSGEGHSRSGSIFRAVTGKLEGTALLPALFFVMPAFALSKADRKLVAAIDGNCQCSSPARAGRTRRLNPTLTVSAITPV